MAAAKPEGRRLGALKILDPSKWAREVRRAMKHAEGRIPDAAHAMGVHERTLYRWLDEQAPSGEPYFADVARTPNGQRRSH